MQQELTCAQTAGAMLEILGSNGENWVKGNWHTRPHLETRPDPVTGAFMIVQAPARHCLAGAWQVQEDNRLNAGKPAQFNMSTVQDIFKFTFSDYMLAKDYPSPLAHLLAEPLPAVAYPAHDSNAMRVLAQIIREQFPERVRDAGIPVPGAVIQGPGFSGHMPLSWQVIVAFNDSLDTSWQDVRLVLDKLAAAED